MARKISDYIIIGLKGMGMGAADVIPGVSGGTIAFISGIYQELIDSIKSVDKQFLSLLLRFKIAEAWKHINGTFLLCVLGGILISVFSLAKVLTFLLEHHTMLVYAFFFGLIIGSSYFVGRTIKKINIGSIIFFIAGTSVAYWITIASPATTPDQYWFIFLSGAIAICAMILPGISGSFILLLMGKYEFILNAVKEFKIGILALFAGGCLFGILGFSHVISWLFKKHPNFTVALLTGFMVGSLNKLWPWKQVLETGFNSHGEVIPIVEKSILPGTYTQITGQPNQLGLVLACIFAGLVIIFIFEFIGDRVARKKN
ncbi:MAG: DUF368 domain-containing protein [Bacteroidales bacterium]|nr:DUF368 domain-containing protein [Bacteroidales bacterium]